ncbi:hypothetical protein [Microlunatus speluncae]|uniref:hypothetical protein n=1 Tax=Microlunatus speluncae TaxID=2594267 RepID=UPI0012666B10|nr:hypothetical protein [Microlunatus speluncae]
MATLQRRVQILFDPAQYAALEDEARASKQSVAAVVREAVDERLRRGQRSKEEALARLLARAEAHPNQGPIDWDEEKESFEREYLKDLP